MFEIPDEIRNTLENTLCHSGELNRALYALSTKEGNGMLPVLEKNLKNCEKFTQIVEELVESTKTKKNNRRYREDMEQIWYEKKIKL